MTGDILKLPSDQDNSGRDLGEEEITLLKEVISSGVLNSIRGTKVARFEREFASFYGVPYAVAVSSGTAAVHAAVAALNLEPGSEIITTPITDMGAITPILYESCVPVFADVDPFSYNVTAETIQKRITSRTKAVIVTHLFGDPCQMDGILALAAKHDLPVIEDCGQALMAEYRGQKAGTLGTIGVFSMQQGKHMTTGEGGIVITKDSGLARRIRLFVNKAWGYGDEHPDHYFLALNYRLTELQAAVAIAQLKKLPSVAARRRAMARRMDDRLRPVKGIRIPQPPVQAAHSYWRYCLDIDPAVLGLDAQELASRLKPFGILSVPRYIQKPAFRCEVLIKTDPRYQDESWCRREYPGAYQALSRILVLPWNEHYTERHVDAIADRILRCVSR